jgi:3-oxoacyl-[acyl-carrier-protein] synthase II
MKKKVYILDYDLISPLGVGKAAVFQSLENNYAAESVISRFDIKGIPFHIAAEVKHDLKSLYELENGHIKDVASFDRKFELTVSVFNLVRERFSSLFSLTSPERKGVVFGMGADVSPFELMEEEILHNAESYNPFYEGIREINSRYAEMNVLFNPYDLHAVYLAEKLGLGAFQKTSLTACAASTQAVGLAFEAILNGEADIVLAGGSDSILNAMAFSSFCKLGVLSTITENGKTCKPFDVNRCGTLGGEAAGLCIVAGEDFVKEHNITPLFEILAYGNTLDAYQITSPDPEGKGMIRVLEQSLAAAGLDASEIDYINLHGTGTGLNDRLELFALKQVFGPALKNIPASSTKDRHGHAIAAAGIQELCVLCLSLENNFIPCNMNLEKPIDNENADLVQHSNRYKEIKTGMNCNYSFGGVNTALIIQKTN